MNLRFILLILLETWWHLSFSIHFLCYAKWKSSILLLISCQSVKKCGLILINVQCSSSCVVNCRSKTSMFCEKLLRRGRLMINVIHVPLLLSLHSLCSLHTRHGKQGVERGQCVLSPPKATLYPQCIREEAPLQTDFMLPSCFCI